MTTGGEATVPVRKSRRLQVAAVLVLAVLACLYNYLETIPVARPMGRKLTRRTLLQVAQVTPSETVKGFLNRFRTRQLQGIGPSIVVITIGIVLWINIWKQRVRFAAFFQDDL